MRFDRSRVQTSAGGFVGAEIEVMHLTASRMSTPIDPSGTNVGPFGISDDIGLANAYLVGTNLGGLGYADRSFAAPLTSSRLPSWTNRHLGQNAAFVLPTLSSSNHESQTMNFWRSGSEGLESSPVPASASLYYSKRSRYNTIVVKKTASFFDTVVPFSGVIVPSQFLPGTGSYVTFVTGANTPQLSCSFRYPATIRVDVPVSGRLVDIKVWVELVHLSGGVDRQGPLGELGLALRSPNVRWGNAHPIRNDPRFVDTLKNAKHAAYLSNPFVIDEFNGNALQDLYYPPANFYRDTFLMWEGPGMCIFGLQSGSNDHAAVLGYTVVGGSSPTNATNRAMYPSWNRDRGMRTVFADGASNPNPRHLFVVPARTNYNSTNSRTNPYTFPSGNAWYGSPNANGILQANPNAIPTPNHNPAQIAAFEVQVSAFGADWPWTSDVTVFPATESHQAAGSPPKGWLSGPAKTAGANEWPTTGVNYGPETIQPLYPLLDDIFQKKSIGSESPIIGSIVRQRANGEELPAADPTVWSGFRPGLRGTEISGTWELLIAQGGQVNVDPQYGMGLGIPSTNAYFRQVRLEITYDTGIGPRTGRAPRRVSPKRSGPNMVNRISGSAPMFRADESGSWDSYVSEDYSTFSMEAEVGRTFGLHLNTGSFNRNDFALVYQITGTLADYSGSSPGWLLNNRFGMPQIPISSASLVGNPPQPVVGIHPQEIISVRPLVDGTQRLTDAARDALPPKLRAVYAAELVTGSLT